MSDQNEVEFKAWPKIPRDNPFMVTITEKINGTNACVIIKDNKIVGVQSRKRLITPDHDNYGFAQWVSDNNDDLEALGDGYHYGEWAGLGIQKNPHDLPEKRLFLFNTFRFNEDSPYLPRCCFVVPILYQGIMNNSTIQDLLTVLKESAGENETPEGVVVYSHAFRSYTKHTIISPSGKWCKQGVI